MLVFGKIMLPFGKLVNNKRIKKIEFSFRSVEFKVFVRHSGGGVEGSFDL